MNLRQVCIFHTVMMTKTLTEAAEQLGTSQPAVSSAIKTIEQETGVELFKRLHGRLYPMPEAQQLQRTAVEIFNSVNYLHRQVAELRDGTAGHAIIATIPALAGTLVARAVSLLRETRPNVEIEIRAISNAEVIEAIVKESVDLGVVYAPSENIATQEMELFKSNIICAMPRGHPLARKRSVSPTDLANEALISFPDNSPMYWMLQKAFQSVQLPYKPAVVTNQTLTAYALVQLGTGLALTDPFLNQNNDAFPGVITRLFEPPVQLRPRVLWPRHRSITGLNRQIVEVLKKTSINFKALSH